MSPRWEPNDHENLSNIQSTFTLPTLPARLQAYFILEEEQDWGEAREVPLAHYFRRDLLSEPFKYRDGICMILRVSASLNFDL